MKKLFLLAFLILCPQLALAQAPTKLCAVSGDQKSCVTSLFPSSSAVLASSQVVSVLPANLWSFEVSADATLSAATWTIMIFDAIAAPADGAVVPVKCYVMPTGTTNFSASFLMPIQFRTGVVISVSTTAGDCFNKTASTHAFISGDAR